MTKQQWTRQELEDDIILVIIVLISILITTLISCFIPTPKQSPNPSVTSPSPKKTTKSNSKPTATSIQSSLSSVTSKPTRRTARSTATKASSSATGNLKEVTTARSKPKNSKVGTRSQATRTSKNGHLTLLPTPQQETMSNQTIPTAGSQSLA